MRSNDEEKFTRMEEKRKAAVEMAQKEDEAPKETAEDAQSITMTQRGYGVTRYPRGLQLSGMIGNGFADR